MEVYSRAIANISQGSITVSYPFGLQFPSFQRTLEPQAKHFGIPAFAGMTDRCAGFTLIEMSIVIVIIGLLIGGVLVGQSLIRSAELQTVTTDMSQFQTAAKQFQDQYYALPGDFSTAQTVFGELDPTPATCKTTPSVTRATCNGDGDGRLETDPVGSNEWFRFWQQLLAAEMIEGRFTGVAGSGGATHAVPGENVPNSEIGNGGWTARWIDNMALPANYFDGGMLYRHVLEFGNGTAAGLTNDPILTPGEALNIDTKLDDGRPATGNVIAYPAPVASNCTDAANVNDLDSDYAAGNIDDETATCSLVFREAF